MRCRREDLGTEKGRFRDESQVETVSFELCMIRCESV
jgi:hypothetical protein